jgi:hypothetical protein
MLFFRKYGRGTITESSDNRVLMGSGLYLRVLPRGHALNITQEEGEDR